MTCSMCDNNKQLKSASITHRYRESGLDNIILHGVKETRCDECGEVYYNFGDIDALHQMIAQQLIVKSDDLTGPEVRFLRKFLGYSSGVFAKLVGYEIEHLSRLENGKTPVQKTFDHLVRLMVAKKIPDRDYDLQDLFLDGKAVKLEWLEFALKGKDWRPAKAG